MDLNSSRNLGIAVFFGWTDDDTLAVVLLSHDFFIILLFRDGSRDT